jgi:hypothetical protein
MKRNIQIPRHCPAWYVQVAEEMSRNSINFKEACVNLGIKLDHDEATRIEKRKDFQEILRVEQNKYFAMVANDPTRTKSTVLGKLIIQAELLHKQGDYDKAAVVLEKVAKIEGWTGADQNVNVFAGLSARDIQEAKERLGQEALSGPGSNRKSLTN